MNYILDDRSWLTIVYCYERNSHMLSPTTIILVENLMTKLQTNRVITSSDEANILITLLLTESEKECNESPDEEPQAITGSHKDDWYEDRSELVKRINQVIEQLRLFTNSLDTYTKDCSKEQSRWQ